jgi:hypothetical protein
MKVDYQINALLSNQKYVGVENKGNICYFRVATTLHTKHSETKTWWRMDKNVCLVRSFNILVNSVIWCRIYGNEQILYRRFKLNILNFQELDMKVQTGQTMLT